MRLIEHHILDSEYFPCIGWYQVYTDAASVSVDVDEYFQRASLRNRCYVCGPNGKIALSVPLQGGRNQRITMKDVKVCSRTNWQRVHWRTLMACYGRSPYFEYYADAFQAYFETKFLFLIDLNQASLELINKLSGMQPAKIEAQQTNPETEIQTMNHTRQFNAHSAPCIRNVQYVQPFVERHGFVQELSMIDLLFCAGNQTKKLLQAG
jgi:hypothetical protein